MTNILYTARTDRDVMVNVMLGNDLISLLLLKWYGCNLSCVELSELEHTGLYP